MQCLRSSRIGARVHCRRNSSITNNSPSTHTVFNQSKALVSFNVYKSDPALTESMKTFCAVDLPMINDFGIKCGSPQLMYASEVAEKNKPVLRQFDIYGRRVDVVDYHDAYHTIMKHGIENGCAGYGFKHGTPGSQVTRAAIIYMENQLEAGHCCPITMTAAAIPVLKKTVGTEQFVEKIYSQSYDPRDIPVSEKTGVILGMSMTEKQGGSDVRANTTTAVPVAGEGDNAYHLTGHKVRRNITNLCTIENILF